MKLIVDERTGIHYIESGSNAPAWLVSVLLTPCPLPPLLPIDPGGWGASRGGSDVVVMDVALHPEAPGSSEAAHKLLMALCGCFVVAEGSCLTKYLGSSVGFRHCSSNLWGKWSKDWESDGDY